MLQALCCDCAPTDCAGLGLRAAGIVLPFLVGWLFYFGTSFADLVSIASPLLNGMVQVCFRALPRLRFTRGADRLALPVAGSARMFDYVRLAAQAALSMDVHPPAPAPAPRRDASCPLRAFIALIYPSAGALLSGVRRLAPRVHFICFARDLLSKILSSLTRRRFVRWDALLCTESAWRRLGSQPVQA